MKYLLSLFVIFSFSNIFAQAFNVVYQDELNPNCQIHSIILTDSTSHVILKYVFEGSPERININEEAELFQNKNNKHLRLLSTVNIPIFPAYHLSEKKEDMYFALTFEKINLDEPFDLIADKFQFRNVQIGSPKSLDKEDYLSLLNKVPQVEKGYFYKDGILVQYGISNGYIVTAAIGESEFLKNHQLCYISIENYNSKRVDFFPENISAFLNDRKLYFQSLSYSEYDRKIEKKQNLITFFVALGEYSEAMNAGQTNITTNYNGMSYSRTGGYFFNSSFGFGMNTRTYSNGSVNTSINNNAISYFARKDAENTINNLTNEFASIREVVNQGYLKSNTIFPNQRVNGYVSFEFNESWNYEVSIPVGSENFKFTWPFTPEKQISKITVSNGVSVEEKNYIDGKASSKKTLIPYKYMTDVKIGDIVKFSTICFDDEFHKIQYGIIEEITNNGEVKVKYYSFNGKKVFHLNVPLNKIQKVE
jgi:hypothetical protein